MTEIRGDLSLESQSRSWRLVERKRSREGKDLRVVEGGSEMEGFSRRKMTLRKSNVAEVDRGRSCLWENECGEGSELDSGEYKLIGESSRHQGHVSSS